MANKCATIVQIGLVLLLLMLAPTWAQDYDSGAAKQLPPHIAGAYAGFLNKNTTDDSVSTDIEVTFVQNDRVIEGIWQQTEATGGGCFPQITLLAVGTFEGVINLFEGQSPATFKATFTKTAINSEGNAAKLANINRCSMKLEGDVTVSVVPILMGTYTSCKGETGTFQMEQESALGAAVLCP
jgi:hypothetical protein